MKLMIVESPNKVKTIEGYLGAGWRVVASVGHIRDLPNRGVGIEPPSFDLQYEFVPGRTVGDRTFPGGKERVDRIRALARDAEMVYLATDPDREGEAIAWHLKEALNLSERDYVRVTFDEITEPAIRKAIQAGRKIDYRLVRAQEGRRALDRFVGYLVSPLLSDLLGERLSAGRVQSVAVRLVVDQERRIQAFKKTDHYGAAVSFDGGSWKAEWDTSPFVTEGAPYVLDKELAQAAAGCRQFRVMQSSSSEARKAPPSPFSTSLMLQAASVSLKLDPEVTTKAAQRLFEQGLITYIRTDGVNISDDAAAEIRELANARGWQIPSAPRSFKAKGGAQEAHEAIRPTHIEQEEAGQDDTERALYRLIWQRTVASQLADARYTVNDVQLEAADSSQPFQFRAKGRMLIEPGWRVLTAKDAVEDQDEEEQGGRVPVLDQGATKTAESGELLLKATKAPGRFTKASLIARLEKEGIGRPATYAAIMANVMNRAYLEEQKRFLVPTTVGYTIVDNLVKGGFGFMELDFTRELEAQLDQVAEGQSDFLDVVGPAYELLQGEIDAVRRSGQFKPRHACPKCQSALRRFQRKDKATGKPIRGAFGWSCTAGDDCRTFLDDEKGEPVQILEAPCPDCGKTMYRRKGDKGYWWACSGYPDCKTTRPDDNGKPGASSLREDVRCPVCDKPTRYLSGKSAKTKKAYSFFSCSNRECKGTVPADKNGNPQKPK